MPGTNGSQKPGKSTSSRPSPKGKSHSSSKGKHHSSSKGKSHPSSKHPKQSTQVQKAKSDQAIVKKESAVHFRVDATADSSVSLNKHVLAGQEPQVVKKKQTPAHQQGSPAKKSPSQMGGLGTHKSRTSSHDGSLSLANNESGFGLPGIIYRNLPRTRKKRSSSTVSNISQSPNRRSSRSQSQSSSTSSRRSSGSDESRARRSSGSHPKSSFGKRSKSSGGRSSKTPSRRSSKSPSGRSSKSPSSGKSSPKPKPEEHHKVSFGYAVAFEEASESQIAVVILPVKDCAGSSSHLPSEIPEPLVQQPVDEAPVHSILHNKGEKLPKGTWDPPDPTERKPKKPLDVVLHEQFCTPRVISYVLGAVIVSIIVIVIVVLVKLLNNA